MRRMRVAARAVVVVLFVSPVVLMAVGSLQALNLPPPSGLYLAPSQPGVEAYGRLAHLLPLARMLRNSSVVVALAVPLTVVIATLAGFGMAIVGDRARRRLVGVTVALLVVPLPTLWVVRFVLYRSTGVLDSLVPLWAPALAATTPFTVLLAYRAFRRLPCALWEAAALEGSSLLRTWWSVGLPQIHPTATAIAVLAFSAHWGNYLDALLYLRSPDLATLAVGVAGLKDLDPSDAPVALAGALVLSFVPLAILALVQGRLFAAVEKNPSALRARG